MTTRIYNKRSKTGFSLVEMLIYIAILILMLGVILNITTSMVQSGRIIKALRNVENSALSSFERITREIRQAESVNLASSILNSSPGRLVLVGTDDLGNPRTVDLYLSNGVLMLDENGSLLGAISQPNATITNLVFRRFSSANSEGIRTEITIESGTSTHYRSNNYYFSAILR